MSKTHWLREPGCGLLAGIVWIILGAKVTGLLGREFAALSHNPPARPAPADKRAERAQSGK